MRKSLYIKFFGIENYKGGMLTNFLVNKLQSSSDLTPLRLPAFRCEAMSWKPSQWAGVAGEKADNGGSSLEHVYYAKSPNSAIIHAKFTTRIKASLALVIVQVDVGMHIF